MITKCASNFKDAAVSAAQTVHKSLSEFRIPTRTLGTALYILNTGAGVVAYQYNPEATLAGGILGAMLRRAAGDNPSSTPISDSELRANRIARMCFTSVATAYTTYTGTTGNNITAALVGVECMTNGIYPVVRKLIG